MAFTTKAVAVALLLAITPTIGLAQGYTHFGPGSGGAAPIAGGSGFVPVPGSVVTPVQPVQRLGCGAPYAQSLIGQNASTLPLPPNVRVIGPDTVVTFDYRPDRLNLSTDNYGTIIRAYCG